MLLFFFVPYNFIIANFFLMLHLFNIIYISLCSKNSLVELHKRCKWRRGMDIYGKHQERTYSESMK